MALEPITREEKIMSGESLEPITRKELFLAKAAGMDVKTPEPITREEMFLNMITGGGGTPGGGSGVIEPLTITENGTYEAPEGVEGYSPVVVNVAGSGGGEKILYMDAALLNAGGAYPVDADDYTTAVIPAEATFVDMEAFANLPNLDTLIVMGECEFETYSEYDDNTKSTTYYNAVTKHGIPIRTLIAPGLAETPGGFMKGVATLADVVTSGSVGNQAFAGCTYLERVTLINCEAIGTSAFYNCALAEVALPSGLTSIGGTAFRNCALTEVIIPEGVTVIGNNAFDGCTALAKVTLPSSLTGVGLSAFKNCALTEVTIPAGVASIESYTFQNCDDLATITILGMETAIYDTTIPSTTKIRAYAGSAAETFATTNGYTFEVIE